MNHADGSINLPIRIEEKLDGPQIVDAEGDFVLGIDMGLDRFGNEPARLREIVGHANTVHAIRGLVADLKQKITETPFMSHMTHKSLLQRFLWDTEKAVAEGEAK